ncbi:MAG TPA: hypothetical protein ENI64_13285 [Gammaproteobacteria bacterium]|nr:hypothetical protein [Gammaproteobacteria bacterium]
MYHHRNYPVYPWPFHAYQGQHSQTLSPHEILLGLRFDRDGYLIDLDKWDEGLADYLAERAGWSLTPQRWAIIHALRASYKQQGGNPSLRHVCHCASLDRHCIDTYFDMHGRDVWRIAGLPNPGEEAQAYLQ